MPREREKRKRLRQIYRWLKASFPTPYPTRLRFVTGTKRLGHQGYVTLAKGRVLVIVIDVKPSYRLYQCIDTLIHEHSHCSAWNHTSLDPYVGSHSSNWGVEYAKQYSAYMDEGGQRESWDY